jgi:hypothetical protein
MSTDSNILLDVILLLKLDYKVSSSARLATKGLIAGWSNTAIPDGNSNPTTLTLSYSSSGGGPDVP